MRHSAISLLLWPVRLVIYAVCIYVAFFVIRPAIGGIGGLLVSIPFAALAVGLDLFVTARLRGLTIEQAATTRMLFVDALLSPQGESLLDQGDYGELEAGELVEAELLDDGDRPRLGDGN